MSLWVDKYRPKTLHKIDYHEDITQRLKSLASSGDFPHLLVYGPSGAGKKTRVLATLYELYGPRIEKMRIDVKTFKTPTNRKLEFNVVSSPFHLEVTPSDLGNNDRVIIQDLLKEIGQTEQIDFQTGKHRFKVVIINEADSLSRDAQAALRRTMEKYSTNIRLILISNSTSNIIAPIKSRTLLIRVSLPTVDEISGVLRTIATKEDVSVQQDTEVFAKIAQHSQRNLRKSILAFEALAMTNDTISTTTPLIELDWEQVIGQLSQSIIKDQSVKSLYGTRSILYDLISHCIPPKIILKTLTMNLLTDKRIKEEHKYNIVEASAIFDERLSLGNKEIFHLEGFIGKVMLTIY